MAVIFLFVISLICWVVHLSLINVPVQSDAGFFEGVAHGVWVFVNAVRRTFGADIGLKDFVAGLPYEIGFVLGATLIISSLQSLLSLIMSLCFRADISGDRAILGRRLRPRNCRTHRHRASPQLTHYHRTLAAG